ncbi:MAG: sulfite exporter TauE/SafE family protein [Acidimicrobiaceae bacterium]|nr:sulfite exporter TauE/SafE family protein [Acidimicrobiaceae bacterium]
MSLTQDLLILVAAFGAGAVNAMAGGGSLISFPALLAVGLPPITANVTNSIAVWPGYVGSVIPYRAHILDQKDRAMKIGALSVLGSILGTIVLLEAPPAVFKILVPYLIFTATTLLLIQKQMLAFFTKTTVTHPKASNISLNGGILLASIYGSYFGAGLGIMLLSILASFIREDLQRLNGLKTLLSLIIATIGSVIYAIFAPVQWEAVAIMALASLLGGYFGAGLARKLSPGSLKISVIIFGYLIGLVLLVKG